MMRTTAAFTLALIGLGSARTTTTPACTSFKQWTVRHNRVYANDAQAKAAESAFNANCARFDALNQVPGGARFEADEHADHSPDDFAAKFGGCLSLSSSQPPVKTAHEIASVVAPSKSIDWRTRGQVTPIKNQGAFGTCWSFAVAENLEGLNVRQGNTLTNISEQEFISCCPQCQGRAGEVSFTWLVNNSDGRPALEASWPYEGKPGSCKNETAPRAPVTLHSWGRIEDDGTGVPIVEALLTHGPMGLGVDARCFQGYHSGVIRNCTSTGVDHAVLMVAAGVDTGVNYFTIKNSWGSKWGEEGYVRIEQGHKWWGPISTIYTN